jgi:hypothetical protein
MSNKHVVGIEVNRTDSELKVILELVRVLANPVKNSIPSVTLFKQIVAAF